MPRRSTPIGLAARVSGTVRLASSRPTMPTGTLTRKIGRQPVPAMSATPARRRAAARPRWTGRRPRRSSPVPWNGAAPVVVAWMVDSTCGSIIADAAPCATLASTSVSRRRREAAGQGRDRERRHAQQEQPPPAERVAEAAAKHQQQRVADAVTGDDQFQRGGGRVQVGVDGRQRDVDDEEVDHRQCRADQDDQQSSAGVGRCGWPCVLGQRAGWRRWRRGECAQVRCHGTTMRPNLTLVARVCLSRYHDYLVTGSASVAW